MAEQQSLWLECQVAVGDGNPQRFLFGRSRTARRRNGRHRGGLGAEHASADRLSPDSLQQAAIGQALARIHAVERLLQAEERVDEKVHRFCVRKKVDVGD